MAPDTVAVWIGRVLLALAVTYAWLVVLRRLGRVLSQSVSWIEGRLHRRGRGVAVRSVEVLSVDAISRFVRSLVGTTRAMASIAVTYVWLLIVAASLDATHRVFGVVVQPLLTAISTAGSALLGFIPNLAMLLVIFAAARFSVRTLGLLAEAVAARRLALSWLEPELAHPTRRLVTIAVWALALVMSAPYLPGSDSRAFMGVAIMIGILLSLGATSVTSNVLAGLVLTYSRAYRVGDRVRIGDMTGEVVTLGALSTRLKTDAGEEVIIPNSVVQSGRVVQLGSQAAFAVTSPPPPIATIIVDAPAVEVMPPIPPPAATPTIEGAPPLPSDPVPRATMGSAPEAEAIAESASAASKRP